MKQKHINDYPKYPKCERMNFNNWNTLIQFFLAEVRLEVIKFILTTSFVLLAPGKPRF